MIKSFRDKEAAAIFHIQESRRYVSLQKIILKKLLMLHAAVLLDDLRNPPGNRLETLRGNRKGQLSIRINDQFRLCFLWKEGHAYEVEIADYH